MLIAVALAAASTAAPASLQAQSPDTADERRYDIPERPVAQALAEFATVSGVNIIYRQSLAADRRSTALSGKFAAPAALRRLLQGTGLAARFTSPTSAIIYVEGGPPPSAPRAAGAASAVASLRLDMAEVRAPRTVGKPDRSAFDHYAQRVQTEILDRLKRDGAYQGRKFRIEIAVTVDPAGRVAELALLRSSDDAAWDARVRELLLGETLRSPPPAGFTQSMRFEVETDRFADPGKPGGQRRP